MTKTANGAFRGLRRFQIIEPIASPTALLRNGVRGIAIAEDEKMPQEAVNLLGRWRVRLGLDGYRSGAAAFIFWISSKTLGLPK